MLIDCFICCLDMFVLLISHSLGFHLRLSHTWIGMNWFNFLSHATCFEPMNITWYEILYIHVLHAHLFVLPSVFTTSSCLSVYSSDFVGVEVFWGWFWEIFWGGGLAWDESLGWRWEETGFLRVFFWAWREHFEQGGCFYCDFFGSQPTRRGALESWG